MTSPSPDCDDPTNNESLPRLRPELTLVRGTPGRDTGSGWVIYDPVQHRHFQIDQSSYELLSVWSECYSIGELITCTAARFDTHYTPAQIEAFLKFLEANCLLIAPAEGGWRHYQGIAELKSKAVGGLTWLVHNYLFFRVPLLRPQRFLQALYSRFFAIVVIFLGAIGLYLTSRQWEGFLKTTDYFFTWEGLISFGIALIIIKLLHELGHAYTAVRHGCFVPTIGVAFMLLTPLLYTDVSDAWKLQDRRKRLAIDSAGIVVELAVACIATFIWAFLPDGPMRSVAFMLATAGWIMSLAVNLNPFMRFDGYYLFSELVGIENLQSRAFALARWRLREILFGLGHLCPESLPPRIIATMIFWAWATWIYRLLLFIGIALLVYTYCFKVLGIILFVLEIAFLVAKPIWNELREWYEMRKEIAVSNRSIISAVVAAAILMLAIVPWSQSVRVPAMVQLSDTQGIHTPRSAKIQEVHIAVGQSVVEGDALFTLQSDEIESQIAKTETEIKLLRLRLGRGNVDNLDREESLVLRRNLHSLQTRRIGLLGERSELTLRAPIAGRVLELDQTVHAGRWIKPSERLALIGTDSNLEVTGFVHEDDVWRLSKGTTGTFIPDTPLAGTLDVKLREIAVGGAAEIKMPSLASHFGGTIAVERDETGRLIPVKAQYQTSLELISQPVFQGTMLRGVVHLQGAPESLLAKFWRRTLNVLVRESGA